MTKRWGAAAVVAVVLLWGAPAGAGPLGDKAAAYDAGVAARHLPGYGGALEYLTATPDTIEPVVYAGMADSAYHTGGYLASQAYRFAVTGDPAARDNVLRAAGALHAFLDVTRFTDPAEVAPGREGKALLARWVGPATAEFLTPSFPWTPSGCALANDRHLVTSGPYAGSCWIGNISRDQTSGWFFGLAAAAELLPELRPSIGADVAALIRQIRSDGYVLVDVDGLATGAGPEVGPLQRLAWHKIAAAVSGDPELVQIYDAHAWSWIVEAWLTTILDFARYSTEYFTFGLANLAMYPLIRLETDPGRRRALLDVYDTRVARLTNGTGNVAYDFLGLGAGAAVPAASVPADIVELGRFPAFPDRYREVVPPPAAPDPMAKLLYDVNALLRRFVPSVPQYFQMRSLAPRALDERCPGHWIWNSTPHSWECLFFDGADRVVFPGSDYLLAYWLGRYHGLVQASD